MELTARLEQLARLGVDLDGRGDTCWWVLVAGEQVGWVRRSRGGYVGTMMRQGRRKAEAEQASFDSDGFELAVEWVAVRGRDRMEG